MSTVNVLTPVVPALPAASTYPTVKVRTPCVVLVVLNLSAATMSSTVLAVNAPPPFLLSVSSFVEPL